MLVPVQERRERQQGGCWASIGIKADRDVTLTAREFGSSASSGTRHSLSLIPAYLGLFLGSVDSRCMFLVFG